MDLGIQGKKAIVCASSKGLGRACALSLVQEGVDVIINSRNEEDLKKVKTELSSLKSGKVDYIVADLNSEEGRENIVSSCPEADILINNNGGPPPVNFLEIEKDQWLEALESNLLTAVMLIKALLPGMQERKFGRIINIISISVKAPIDNLGVSNTVRWAMASWAKTLSNEVAEYGITVNNILPGFTDTERLQSLLKNRALSSDSTIKEITNNTISNIPAKRFGKPEEIADATSFLCSKSADYINGINLPIDGGFSKSL